MIWRVIVQGDVARWIVEVDCGDVEVRDAGAFCYQGQDRYRFAIRRMVRLLVEHKTGLMTRRRLLRWRHRSDLRDVELEV